MLNSRRYISGRLGPALIAFAIMLGGCASKQFSPEPLSDPAAMSSFQTHTIDDVTVATAILTDEEAQAHFGADLGVNGVQALWVRVSNASPQRYWLIRNIIDADLYSSDEAAALARKDISGDAFDALVQYFRDESMPVLLEPGMVTQGHVFVPRQEGGRYVEIRLASDAYEAESLKNEPADRDTHSPKGSFNELRFDFALTLPDGNFDYEQLDTERIYAGQNLPEFDDEGLREALTNLPCCVSNEDSDSDGDPLNIVLVGSYRQIMFALTRAGWSFTHRINFESVQRMMSAALDGERYAVAPVSNLYLFNRKQDIALQRARRSIAQRNHMRLWLAPFTHDGTQVWVGQVSRDIGVKLTTHSPSLTTHVIDPEVDLTREYLLHSLLAEGFVHRFGFVKGSMEATREKPAVNLAEDPYFSDGLRLVLVLSSYPLPYTEVRSLLWEQSAPPVAEGQTRSANRNVWPIGAQDRGERTELE